MDINVAKRTGVKQLTPARALMLELMRRYSTLGFDCALLEVHKLAWFFERHVKHLGMKNPMQLQFVAHRYGPYAHRLEHLLNALDGSYLHSEKRIADAGPIDPIHFDFRHKETVIAYLRGKEAKRYEQALEQTAELIDGFESPLGMELLATVDWLLHRENRQPELADLRSGIAQWPAGAEAAARKQKIFSDRYIELALKRIQSSPIRAAE